MAKIFIFINSNRPGWVIPLALAEDGYCLANHCCSHECFVKHDMGIGSDWKHEIYKEHYPDGYELEYVEEKDIKTHPGIQTAFKLNQEIKNAKLPDSA